MVERIDISVFFTKTKDVPILDVRSPQEYNSGHLPTAHSVPLFSDEERSIVGTIYKEEGRQPAIKKGLDIVGPKMKHLVESAENFGTETLAVYCWRGGMRSDSVAWLLEKYGFKIFVLEGGYKSYRRSITNLFKETLPLYIISGFTGSKKTHLLNRIQYFGGQIVDLEGRAQHQGSSFGNQKSQGQPSTEQFQNLIFEDFRALDLTRPIFVEDECQRIGQVSLPDDLYRQMRKSKHLLIDVSKEERVEFLLAEYGQLEKNKLISATQAISRKLGYDNALKAISAIEEGDLRTAVSIILIYYDKRYKASREKKEEYFKYTFQLKMDEIDTLAEELANYEL